LEYAHVSVANTVNTAWYQSSVVHDVSSSRRPEGEEALPASTALPAGGSAGGGGGCDALPRTANSMRYSPLLMASRAAARVSRSRCN
jgi:hypothetical protein